MKVLLNTAYWPNLHYFYYVLGSEQVYIEIWDNYHKQSFRNRTRILSANGALDLTIPVKKIGGKQLSKDVAINYTEKWQINHWRAITSAYKNSPYFEYFEDEVRQFYTHRFEKLLDYNISQLEFVYRILKLERNFTLTEQFEKTTSNIIDFRELIHPKKSYREDKNVSELLQRDYYQTFREKFGFIENLSILDLIFNKGLETLTYLKGN